MNNLLERIFAASNLFMAAKDKFGKYIYCNEKIAEAIGLDSPGQIIGKTDYDLCWRDQAKLYIEGDQKVMAGAPLFNVLEPQTHVDGTKKILISKTSILNDQEKCIGVVGSYMDVSNYFVKEKLVKLKTVGGKRFYLGEAFGNCYLTKQEVRVLRLILLGMSVKQIALNLKVSPRTIDCHINKLKLKLQCHTKGDIVMMAIKTGLTFAILDVDNWDS
jgi:DNA-binding CsgD family transcriptional regulator